VPASESAPPPGAKSPNVAAALSLPPTIVGMALLGFGLYTANRDPTCEGENDFRECKDHFPLGFNLSLAGGLLLTVGPTLGHAYNGRVWTTGLKVRVASLGIAAAGVGVALLSPDCSDIVCPMEGIGMLIVLGGAATFVVGAGIEAVTAARAVDERNSQLSLGRIRTSTGSAPALMFNMSF
jgi:hypothetical protein